MRESLHGQRAIATSPRPSVGARLRRSDDALRDLINRVTSFRG